MNTELTKINLSVKTLKEAKIVIHQLSEIIIELKKEVDTLREQLNRNSKNSSLPPSRDWKKKKQSKPSSGRSRGAQPGHTAHQRQHVPLEEVSNVIDCKPETRCACGGVIELSHDVHRHQVFELPVVRYDVIEYRLHKGTCTCCHKKYEAELPAGVSWKGFGPRAQGMIGLLTSKYRLSKRLVTAWFRDVYQMPICLGSVSNMEGVVSHAIQTVHEEIYDEINAAKVVHVDETGHKECSKNGWAWLASTPRHTYFRLARSRGKKIAKELIGDYRGRVIISDRYGAYDYLPAVNHQVCWAHLKRDFQKLAERREESGKIGTKLLESYAQLFCFWKTEYGEDIHLLKKKKRRLNYLKRKLVKWLKRGARCTHPKTARTCENILNASASLWRFFEVSHVSPTNNHAEQQLRPLVISKKLTFGTQSDRGSRFIERIFSVVMTCKQQNRDVLAFLIEAIQKYILAESAPSLA